jgi:ABC-type lipoprotein export system ATPase subunit
VQKETSTTIIIVTHDTGVAQQADRVISLVDGKVATDARQEA